MLRYCFFICVVFYFVSMSFAQNNYDVFMQESPVGAGVIKPGIGMHTYQARESVTLSTAPKPGYRFVGWLGDVRDSTSNRTSMVVDGPKIVIAVFERDEYEFLEKSGPQISQGPPALYPRYDSYTNGHGIIPRPPDEPDDPEYPKEKEFPPPVPEIPEPATMMLFGLGALLINKMKQK